MVANIMPAEPPELWGSVKLNIFQNMVMFHIKSKLVTNAARSKFNFFQNMKLLHIKLMGIEQLNKAASGHVAYQIKDICC